MKVKAYIVHQAMCEPKLEWSKPKDCLSAEPLYTTQSQRTWVGLTEAQCGVLWKTNMTPFEYYQAIEAKLKEKNK